MLGGGPTQGLSVLSAPSLVNSGPSKVPCLTRCPQDLGVLLKNSAR